MPEINKSKNKKVTGVHSDNSSKNSNKARLLELTHNLSERIKELNCLYGISRLVENRNLSIEATLQSVVNLIPPAW